jgi:hypothetical protein
MKGGGSAATGSRPLAQLNPPYVTRPHNSPRYSAAVPSPLIGDRCAGPAPGGQNVRIAISAGAASNPSISGSRRLSVMDVPAMSSEVQ